MSFAVVPVDAVRVPRVDEKYTRSEWAWLYGSGYALKYIAPLFPIYVSQKNYRSLANEWQRIRKQGTAGRLHICCTMRANGSFTIRGNAEFFGCGIRKSDNGYFAESSALDFSQITPWQLSAFRKIRADLYHITIGDNHKPGFNSVENRRNFNVAMLMRVTVTARFALSWRWHRQLQVTMIANFCNRILRHVCWRLTKEK